ncbi:MAG: hypothetical protein JRI46_11305 [Deltaproteobacteria bacterium]|nr:hypothetical protein [Deltaproteobacteria bacterium]
MVFVHEVQFTHLGVFKYSPEEGTRAFRMKGKTSSKVTEERAAQLMELQQGISWKRNQEMIGSVIPVLVDGVVYINKGVARSGKMVEVKTTQADPYDLVGEIKVRA